MDPQAFVKVSISGLGLRIPVASKSSRVGIHSDSIPCFCEISFPGSGITTAPVPLITPTSPEPDPRNVAAVFYLDTSSLAKLLQVGCLGMSSSSSSRKKNNEPSLKIAVFTGRQGSCCGAREGILLGSLNLRVDSEWVSGSPVQVYDSWASIGSKGDYAELHLNVRVEADPRFVFELDGETPSSPQVMQIQASLRQPMFSCKFSRDRSCRARLGLNETPGNWSSALTGESKDRKERKGWLVMIHDLSGSPVAAASIVTPFVPSSGSDYVSRSNPGAWLILRPNPAGVADSWEPWGRLEAWREKSGRSGLGLRFQLVAEGGGITSVGSGVLVSETVINTQTGGEFSIDTVRIRGESTSSSSSSGSPHSSGDCSSASAGLGLPVQQQVGGFVMSSFVHGRRTTKKGRCGVIQMAVRHVTCVEDAAVFVALAAAADLSMDACQPFSRKLRKELSQQPD